MSDQAVLPPKDDPRWKAFGDWLVDLLLGHEAGPCPMCGFSHAEHCVKLEDGSSSFGGCPPFRRERRP